MRALGVYPLPSRLCSTEALGPAGVCRGSSVCPQRATNKGVGCHQTDAAQEPRGVSCGRLGAPMRQVLQELGGGDAARHPRSWSCWCRPGAALSWPVPVPAGSGQGEAASLDPGWGGPGCPWNAGQPSGHLVRGRPTPGKQRAAFEGLGQRKIFIQKEPGPGRPGAYMFTPASPCHLLELGRPLCKVGGHPCHCPGQGLVPRTTQSPSKG